MEIRTLDRQACSLVTIQSALHIFTKFCVE